MLKQRFSLFRRAERLEMLNCNVNSDSGIPDAREFCKNQVKDPTQINFE